MPRQEGVIRSQSYGVYATYQSDDVTKTNTHREGSSHARYNEDAKAGRTICMYVCTDNLDTRRWAGGGHPGTVSILPLPSRKQNCYPVSCHCS